MVDEPRAVASDIAQRGGWRVGDSDTGVTADDGSVGLEQSLPISLSEDGVGPYSAGRGLLLDES